jgi:hypothetical protein
MYRGSIPNPSNKWGGVCGGVSRFAQFRKALILWGKIGQCGGDPSLHFHYSFHWVQDVSPVPLKSRHVRRGQASASQRWIKKTRMGVLR